MPSSSSTPPPHVVEDCRGVLRIYSDGSIVRSSDGSIIPDRDDGTVEWKDLEYSPTHNLQLRVYRPRHRGSSKLPVLLYFHGGGFCIGSRTWSNLHNGCLRLAAELRAVVLAPDYRLAPEHRLPAAIDDGVAAIEWLRDNAGTEPWLVEDADFTSVFVSGVSSGGNITHHLALRYGGGALPLQIKGFLLLMPAFSGTQLTKSEEESLDDGFLTLELTQRYWRLALPVEATVDDPMVNPFGAGGPDMEAAKIGPMLVVVAGNDLLIDRQLDYARRLKELGKTVEVVEFPGRQHGFFTIDPWSDAAGELVQVIKQFMGDTVAKDD